MVINLVKKPRSFKFAFGYSHQPDSGVWSVFSNPKSGDVYISNLRKGSHEMHISLHASGRFSRKAGSSREKMLPSVEISGCHYAFTIFFRSFSRTYPAATADMYTDDILWLQSPKPGEVSTLYFYYTERSSKYIKTPWGDLILADLPAKLNHKPMYFHISHHLRKLTYQEFIDTGFAKPHDVNLHGYIPDAIDLIKYVTCALGVSAATYEPFFVSG